MHYFVGKWQIVAKAPRGHDFVDLIKPGYMIIPEVGCAEFSFGTISGEMDLRVSSREPFLEYSWSGVSEGNPAHGRGLFDFETPNLGEGIFFIHNDEELGLQIERKI